MKNFKKLFAVVASVMMLASTVPTAILGVAAYSDDLKDAYAYSYDLGITTQSSIENADMLGTLKRAHMAKMMVQFAKEVKPTLEADTSKECNYSDIGNQTTEMKDFIVDACQKNLMGVNPDGTAKEAFNPNGVVTRAEFGTVLSRVLYGDANEGGTPFYAEHLNALKDAGIMTKIDNPNSLELRGRVMLMMMRSANPDVSVDCEDPAIAVACLINSSDCPAKCQTAVETNGNLNVKLGTSIDGGDIPNGISSLPVVNYKFTADEDVRLDSLTLKRLGYSDSDTLDGIALFINGGRVSKVATTFNSDEEVALSITNGYEVKAGETVEIAVNVSVSTISTGDQFSLKLTEVASTAKDVSMASNLTSQTFKVLATQSKTLTYSIGNSVDVPKVGEEGIDLFNFILTNPSTNDQDVTLKAITFKEGTGTIDYNTDLENFKLVVDGVTIATADKMEGKYLVFNIDGYVIKSDKHPTFTVKADLIGGSANETINFVVEKAMDILAIGDSYDRPMNIAAAGVYSRNVAIINGKVTLAKVIAAAGDLVGDKDNIFLGAFTITNNSDQGLNLQNLEITFTGDPDTVLDGVKVRLGSASAAAVDLTRYNAAQTGWSETDLGKAIGSKLTVYVYADTKVGAMDGKSLRMSLGTIRIEETQDDAAITEINTLSAWPSMAGKTSTSSLTNVNLGEKTVSKGTEAVEAMQFKIKAGSAFATKIKKITFRATSGFVDSDVVNSAVLMNGTTELAASVKAGYMVVDEDFTIAAGTTATLTLKVDIGSAADVTPVTYTLTGNDIEAEEVSENADTIDIGGLLTGRVINITDAGTLQTDYETNTANNEFNKNILAGETKTVAEYVLYSKYEGVDINDAVVTFVGDADIDLSVLDVQLWYADGTEPVAQDPTWDTTGKIATFTDISDFTTKTSKSSLYIKIVSKAINEENGANTLTATKVDSIVLSDMQGHDSLETVSAGGTISTDSSTFDIIPVTLTPSVATIGISSADLNINTKIGNNEKSDGTTANATITGLVFSVRGNNGSLTKLTVMYGSTVLGSGLASSDTDVTVNFTTLKQVTNGDTKLSVVATASGSIQQGSYTVAVKTIDYYSNVDGIGTPLTAQFGDAKTILVK